MICLLQTPAQKESSPSPTSPFLFLYGRIISNLMFCKSSGDSLDSRCLIWLTASLSGLLMLFNSGWVVGTFEKSKLKGVGFALITCTGTTLYYHD